MRISEEEISIIKNTIYDYIPDAKVFLFGSRVDNNKKGGDIDIFVETNLDITLKDEIKILSKIEMLGLSRKIDLIVKTPKSKEQSIFKTALHEGIIL